MEKGLIMYALIGKTLNSDDNTFYKWVVGVSEDPMHLEFRKQRIRETLKDFNCFIEYDGPFVKKQNILYNESQKIKEILSKLDLDNGCDFVLTCGLDYEIIKTTKIKEII